MTLSSINEEFIVFEFENKMLMIKRMITHFHFYVRFYVNQNANFINMNMKSLRSILKKTQTEMIKT